MPLPKASAFTVGNVVLVPGGTAAAVEARQPGTLAHEAAHTWQYFGLLGLPFLPLYAAGGGLVVAAHRRPGLSELVRAQRWTGAGRLR